MLKTVLRARGFLYGFFMSFTSLSKNSQGVSLPRVVGTVNSGEEATIRQANICGVCNGRPQAGSFMAEVSCSLIWLFREDDRVLEDR